MIYYSFRIKNPYSDRLQHAVTKQGVVTQNKAWEFNVYRTATVFALGLELSMRRDHAGLRLEIGLLGYDVEFQIYDVRHWDYRQKEYV
jgi:hypothetical protein